ncbi:DUF1795 domain-containing protein [Demequina sp. B12]|uniref:hypothetical protein n=1 Tax=Demequina sp. B12 TaxID=2992757 RepID=UPI00237B80D6|nr:hypothetical protein [Demequina sp. B12]MDE0571835.1 DUF1795 domain-containing protein [Demequina sp. B12]
MTQFTYPGPVFAGPPSVALDVPDGWEAKPGLGPAMTFEHADGGKLEVLVTRLRPTESLDDAAKQIAATFAKLPGFKETRREQTQIGGRATFDLEAQVKHPVTRKGYCQVVRYILVEQGETRDLVQLMGTCPAAVESDRAPQIRAMQDSVEIAVESAA